MVESLNFIWAKKIPTGFEEYVFEYRSERKVTLMTVAAADFFQVFADGKLVSYGPERSPAGYARLRKIRLNGARSIRVKVLSYRVPCYSCDMQPPFFGAELFSGSTLVAKSEDFICYESESRRRDVPRYSFQRGFTEVYDFTRTAAIEVPTHTVPSPVLIDGNGDPCNYTEESFLPVYEGPAVPFDEVNEVWWKDDPLYKTVPGSFDPVQDVAEEIKNGEYIDLRVRRRGE